MWKPHFLMMLGLVAGAGVGLLVGLFAGRLLPGVSRGGLLSDLAFGLVGGVLGVGINAGLAHADIMVAGPANVAVALIGAVVVLNLARRIGAPLP